MLSRTSPLFGEIIPFLTPKCLLRYCRLLICSDSLLFCLRKSLGLYSMLIFVRPMITKIVFKNILEGNRIETEPFFSLKKKLNFWQKYSETLRGRFVRPLFRANSSGLPHIDVWPWPIPVYKTMSPPSEGWQMVDLTVKLAILKRSECFTDWDGAQGYRMLYLKWRRVIEIVIISSVFSF